MICKPCAQGADWLSQGLPYPGDVTIARSYHAKCPGCDCQHKVTAQAEGKSLIRGS